MASTTEEINLKLTLDNGKVVSTQIEGVAEDVQDMGQKADRAGEEGAESLERMGNEARETAEKTERAASEMDDISSSSSRMSSSGADQFLFTLGDAAQDAKFGMQGVANNIGMAAEQASMMATQTSGAKGAMSALTSSLLGPAGAVFAIQALIAWGPQIVEFFQSWVSGAEDAAEAEKKLNEETRSTVQTFLDRLRDNPEAAAAGLETLEQAATELQQRLGTLFAEGADPEMIEKVSNRLSAVRNIISSLRQDAESEETFIALTDIGLPPELAQELQSIAANADSAETETKGFAEELKNLQKLSAAGLDLATGIEEELKKAREEYERGQRILESIRKRQQEDQPGPLEGQIGPDRIQAPSLSAEDFQTETITQINSAIGVLQRKMDSVDSSNLQNQMRAAIDDLKSMRREMQLLEGKAIDIGPAIERGLAQAITSAAKAAGKGENIANAVLNTLATLAQRVGSMLISFGTSMLALRTIISDPFTAIAAGSALVALGAAAKQAIGSEIDQATSGRGRRRRGTGREVQGGGEAELNPPSFRTGVDDFGGGLAEVHRGEMLALPPSSNVITNENAEAIRGAMSILSTGASAAGAGTQDVNVTARMDGEIQGPDLFELDTQLQQVRDFKNQFARQ